MRSTASAHGVALAVEALVVDTGAAADPGGHLAATERRGDGGRRGGVADAHLAEHEQVGVEPVDGVAPGGGRLLEALERHRRLEPDVAGGTADADVDRVDGGAGDGGERAHGRLAGAVGGEHRAR